MKPDITRAVRFKDGFPRDRWVVPLSAVEVPAGAPAVPSRTRLRPDEFGNAPANDTPRAGFRLDKFPPRSDGGKKPEPAKPPTPPPT